MGFILLRHIGPLTHKLLFAGGVVLATARCVPQGRPSPVEGLQEDQVSRFAAGAFPEPRFGQCVTGPGRDIEAFLEYLELHPFVCAAQDSVMAYLHEAFGQDVQGKAPDKLGVGEFHCLLPAVFPVVLVGKGDGAFPHFEYPVVGDGDLVGVPSQVFHDRSRSAKGPFGIYHPRFFEELVPECPVEAGRFAEDGHVLGPEYLCHGLYGEEEPALAM